MTAANWIQLAAFLITIATLIVQQRATLKSARKQERRTETKLKIFYLVQKNDLSEAQIVTGLKQSAPLTPTDEVEIRKALYEMLTDETIRFTRDSKYKARTRSPRSNASDSDDEDEREI